MKVKTISHLAFQVKDMEAMLRFYRDALGFRQICDTTYDLALNHIQKQLESAAGPAREGLAAVEREFADKAGKPWFVYLRITDDQLLELFYADETSDSFRPDGGSYRHLSLEVEDIEQARRELLEAGVMLKTEVYIGADATKTLWITDPEGNEIELMEYTADSLQLLRRERA